MTPVSALSYKASLHFPDYIPVLFSSKQGLGNPVNTAVILALMAITEQCGLIYNISELLTASHLSRVTTTRLMWLARAHLFPKSPFWPT